VTDDKVVPLQTGYEPEPRAATPVDIDEVKISLAIIQDELELLSKRVTQLTRIVAQSLKSRK
jgi:hypothetical protein